MKVLEKLLKFSIFITVSSLFIMSCVLTPSQKTTTPSAATSDGDGALMVWGLNEIPRNYVILGVVQVERQYSTELTYADVMATALKVYPNVNALINLRIDPVIRLDERGRRGRMYVATAVAIQFTGLLQ